MDSNRVKALRVARGLSQAVVASEMGLNPGSLSRIECGLRINAEQAIRFARYYNVPLEEFYPEAAGLKKVSKPRRVKRV